MRRAALPRCCTSHSQRAAKWRLGKRSVASCQADAGGANFFQTTLAARRLLFVAGGNTSGRAHVAAAAALALARGGGVGSTLLVDADEPAHCMCDTVGVDLPVNELAEFRSFNGVQVPSLQVAQLSRPETRKFLEHLLAAREWKRVLEQDSGMKMAANMGIPVDEVLGILDCFRPPPGAEMPVALARLLSTGPSIQHVVVDVGAPSLASQLESVPPAVADGLEGLLRLKGLVQKISIPSALSSGFRFLVGDDVRQDAAAQFRSTLGSVQLLHTAMSALAKDSKAILLVLPRQLGPSGVRRASKLLENLKPIGVVLTGSNLDTTVMLKRPPWLPAGVPFVDLPWDEDAPPSTEALLKLADTLFKA